VQLKPIGYVKTPISDIKDWNWGEVQSKIVIDKSLAPGLKGLDNFSHIIVIFYMHKATVNLEKDLVRRPKGCADMPFLGIFAQRAKHRPNPIGITTVPIISVQENVIAVKRLDAIDGTPILDIKPYFPIFDRVDAKTPKWVDELMKGYF